MVDVDNSQREREISNLGKPKSKTDVKEKTQRSGSFAARYFLEKLISIGTLPPDPNKNRFENQKARVAWSIFWVIAITHFFIIPIYIFQQSWLLVSFGSTVCLSALIGIFLMKRVHLSIAIFTVIISIYLSMIVIGTLQGGTKNILIQIIYPILFAFGFLVERRTLTFFSVFTIVWIVALLYIESTGFYTSQYDEIDLVTKSVIIIVIFAVTLSIVQFVMKTITLLNQKLALARKDAENANRLKSEFLANMSHELRTPLNAVIGYSEGIIEEYEDAEHGEWATDQTIEDIERIRRSGRHLLLLINNILDLSKIEAEKMELFIASFQLKLLILDAISLTQPLADKNSNKIYLRTCPDTLELTSDKQKIMQILLNLISNGAKFTHRGEIEIFVTEAAHGTIIITVKDSGVGIPADKLSFIFESFSQVDNSLSRETAGTGLGLKITKRLIEMLGGHIKVESEVGRGSIFEVMLPISI